MNIARRMPDRTPHDGQIWTDPHDGRPMLFVRTEKKSGCDTPTHFFVKTRDRIVFERWIPDGAMPDGYELVSDPNATARAKATRDLMAELEGECRETVAAMQHKVEALEAAMRRAVAVVSPTVGDELRRSYREAMGAHLHR